jgi:glutamate synthase domain-containing protein 3
MILSHHEFTQSKIAAHLLSYWQTAFKHFVKVMPIDYKAVLQKAVSHKLKATGF